LGVFFGVFFWLEQVVAPPAEQEGKFMEAITFYEPIVSKSYDEILEISAIVLGNLCVSYILTMQNDKAEEIMGKIEREEEHLAYEFPDRKVAALRVSTHLPPHELMLPGPPLPFHHVASVSFLTWYFYVGWCVGISSLHRQPSDWDAVLRQGQL
jgi:hypothetical protein